MVVDTELLHEHVCSMVLELCWPDVNGKAPARHQVASRLQPNFTSCFTPPYYSSLFTSSSFGSIVATLKDTKHLDRYEEIISRKPRSTCTLHQTDPHAPAFPLASLSLLVASKMLGTHGDGWCETGERACQSCSMDQGALNVGSRWAGLSHYHCVRKTPRKNQKIIFSRIWPRNSTCHHIVDRTLSKGS